jgi:hypothetical protein
MYAMIDDAAAIYARACSAWYGKRALRVIHEQVRALRTHGDKNGVEAWSKVAVHVAKIQTDPRRRRKSSAKLY